VIILRGLLGTVLYFCILLLDLKKKTFKRVKAEDFGRKGSRRPTMAETTELLVAKVEASRSHAPSSYDSPKKIQKKRLMKRVKISKKDCISIFHEAGMIKRFVKFNI
jgi:hypothetical protein